MNMQEYRNALNRQQSDQLAKIQQRQQQQIQLQQEQIQKQQVEIQQRQQIQQIQNQQEIQNEQVNIKQEIQNQQINIKQGEITNEPSCYYASDITQIYAERHWSEKLVNDDSVLLFVLTTQGDILYCSDSCQGLTGYSASDVIGHGMSEFLHPDDQPQFYTLLDRVFETPLRLSQIDFRWKRKNPTPGFASLQCYGYSKPDEIPTFTFSQSNHLESNYYAFFALAKAREPTTVDILVQLKKENQRLQEQLTQFVAPSASVNNHHPPASSSVISSWMQSDVASIPWIAPQNTTTTATAQIGTTNGQLKMAIMDDHVSSAQLHQEEALTKRSTKNAKVNTMDDDNTKKKTIHDDQPKKMYVTMEKYHCLDCGSTNSPEWRKGPLGRKTLCNACGLRWAKRNKKVNLH